MRYWNADIRQPLEFLSAGQLVSSAPWTHSRRQLDSYEIIIGIKGTLHMQQREERYAVSPGCVLLLLPGETHGGCEPSPGELSFYWLHFLCPGYARIADEEQSSIARRQRQSNEYIASRNDSIYLPIYFRSANPDRIEILFRQLQHLANTRLHHRYALHYIATSLILELAEQSESHETPDADSALDPLISDIVEWIRIHSSEPLGASLIANKFGYNRDYLSRLFKRSMGMSLQEYIVARKLSKAKTLLAESTRTVKQIAHAVGIPDEKYFIRLFRKYERVTPTGYRNAYYRKHLNIE